MDIIVLTELDSLRDSYPIFYRWKGDSGGCPGAPGIENEDAVPAPGREQHRDFAALSQGTFPDQEKSQKLIKRVHSDQ